MSGTRGWRGGVASPRLFGLLAVLLGLLAMHGLASSHHAVAAVPGHAAAAAAPAAQDDAGTQGQQPGPVSVHAGATEAAVHGKPTVAGLTVPLCDDDCPDELAVLCAVVLAATAAAALLLAAAARQRTAAAPADSDVRARAPAAARRSPPRLDPVSDLCVSRT